MNTITARHLDLQGRNSVVFSEFVIDLEEEILGSILLNPEAIEKAKHLPSNAFTQIEHRRIFLAALALHESGKPTDLMSVTQYLHSEGILADAGGQTMLAHLVYRNPCIPLLEERIKDLLQDYHKRVLAEIRVTPETIPQVIYQLEVIQNQSVSVDSQQGVDSSNPYNAVVSVTVNSVNKILRQGLTDFEEQDELDKLQKISSLSKAAFWKLVASLRTRLDEVQHADKIRLNKLIDWSNGSLNFKEALPSMASDILHDAAVLNIDPICIWQYLLPAVLSLAGKKVSLNVESHTIPAIAWTGLVAESGAGKTRAEKLVISPLKALQAQERKRFEAELEEWEKSKEGGEDGEKLPKPVERKYLFEVATIQAVIRRLSEQADNGTLWARDELAGLFKSFGQFSNSKDQEGLECLLKLWDGDGTQVDRVSQEDSFFTEESRLSVAGGIQPGAFRQAFRDKDDAQGLQARFLFAAASTLAPKRVKGGCRLSEKLPELYSWLDGIPAATIRLSKAADDYYTNLYEQIGNQALETSLPSVRAWMFKLPTQLLRIALALHLIECCHGSAPLAELQISTLKRAVLFAQYYRSAFQVLQEKTVDSDEISSILLKIWDAACTRHPDGITTRDAYRAIRAIQYRAKDSGRTPSAYVADLFTQLAEMGKGRVEKQGRVVKFVANLNPPPPTPPTDEDDPQEQRQKVLTLLTVPEPPTEEGFEVSTGLEVSTLTLKKDTELNSPHVSADGECEYTEADIEEIHAAIADPEQIPPTNEATSSRPNSWVYVRMGDNETSVKVMERSKKWITCHVPGVGIRKFKLSEVVRESDWTGD